MNTYLTMKQAHQKEVNDFPFFFAFSNKQFEEGMAKFGLSPNETDKIYSFGGTGGYYLRTDSDRLHEMLQRHRKEMSDAIKGDVSGEGFIFDMFNYELANHEFIISGDIEYTLEMLDISLKEYNKDARLKHGMSLAKKKQYETDGKMPKENKDDNRQ